MTKIVLNINGRSKAVPTACTTRATIKILKTGATAAINVPMIEKTSEVMKSCLVVNH